MLLAFPTLYINLYKTWQKLPERLKERKAQGGDGTSRVSLHEMMVQQGRRAAVLNIACALGFTLPVAALAALVPASAEWSTSMVAIMCSTFLSIKWSPTRAKRAARPAAPGRRDPRQRERAD